jgi:hypothetical protein
MEEVNQAKKDFQEILEADPENKDFHRIYGMYVGQILDVYKEILKHRAIDKDRLLLDALHGIVGYLMDIGENTAAGLIGLHLEEIGETIKGKWQELKAPSRLNGDTKKSAPAFLRSPETRQPKRSVGGNALS